MSYLFMYMYILKGPQRKNALDTYKPLCALSYHQWNPNLSQVGTYATQEQNEVERTRERERGRVRHEVIQTMAGAQILVLRFKARLEHRLLIES